MCPGPSAGCGPPCRACGRLARDPQLLATILFQPFLLVWGLSAPAWTCMDAPPAGLAPCSFQSTNMVQTNDHAPPPPCAPSFGTPQAPRRWWWWTRRDRRPRSRVSPSAVRAAPPRCTPMPGPRGAADIPGVDSPLPAAGYETVSSTLHAGRSAVPGTAADAGHQPRRVRRERQPLGTGTRTRTRPITAMRPRDVAFQNPGTAGRPAAAERRGSAQKSQLGGGSPMLRGFAANRCRSWWTACA